MDTTDIIKQLIAERNRIDAVIKLLSGTTASVGRGRPKGSKNATTAPAKKRGGISPEGRKRIAEAMKKRWAERRKVAKKGA
jgi:hypothetical protein